MGQERAVDISRITYIALAVAVIAVATALSAVTVNFLVGKRGWNAIVSSILSVAIFAGVAGTVHVACVISAIAADQMRTHR